MSATEYHQALRQYAGTTRRATWKEYRGGRWTPAGHGLNRPQKRDYRGWWILLGAVALTLWG